MRWLEPALITAGIIATLLWAIMLLFVVDYW